MASYLFGILILSALILVSTIQTIDADKEANKKVGAFIKFHDKITVKLSSSDQPAPYLEKVNARINLIVDRNNGVETYQYVIGQQWRLNGGQNLCTREAHEHEFAIGGHIFVEDMKCPPIQRASIEVAAQLIDSIAVKELPEGTILEKLKFIKERLEGLRFAVEFFDIRMNQINERILYVENVQDCLHNNTAPGFPDRFRFDFADCEIEEFIPDKVMTKQKGLKFYEKNIGLMHDEFIEASAKVRDIHEETREAHPPRAVAN